MDKEGNNQDDSLGMVVVVMEKMNSLEGLQENHVKHLHPIGKKKTVIKYLMID
jgi:hypothetical protein